MNPLRPQEIEAVRGANVLMGTDRDCMTWIRTYRDHVPASAAAASATSGASSEVGGEAAHAAAEVAASEGGRRRGGREARRARIGG
jgi:5-methyltetrahydrofolate--homocysteine methyltransferase